MTYHRINIPRGKDCSDVTLYNEVENAEMQKQLSKNALKASSEFNDASLEYERDQEQQDKVTLEQKPMSATEDAGTLNDNYSETIVNPISRAKYNLLTELEQKIKDILLTDVPSEIKDALISFQKALQIKVSDATSTQDVKSIQDYIEEAILNESSLAEYFKGKGDSDSFRTKIYNNLSELTNTIIQYT